MSCIKFVETRDISVQLAIRPCRALAYVRALEAVGRGDHRVRGSAPLAWTGIALLNTLIAATTKSVKVTPREQFRCRDYRWSFAGSMARHFLEIRRIECFAQERRHVGWKVCPLVVAMGWLVDVAIDWPSEDFRAARTRLLNLNFDRGPAVVGATVQDCPTSSVDRIIRAVLAVEMFVRCRLFSRSRDLLIRSMATASRPRGLTAACLSPTTSARMAQGRFNSGNEEAGPTGPLPGNYEEKDKQDGACTHARKKRARRRAFSHVERGG